MLWVPAHGPISAGHSDVPMYPVPLSDLCSIVLWLKQQSRMKENSVLLFGENDGMVVAPYIPISSCPGSAFAFRCQHLKQNVSVRLHR